MAVNLVISEVTFFGNQFDELVGAGRIPATVIPLVDRLKIELRIVLLGVFNQGFDGLNGRPAGTARQEVISVAFGHDNGSDSINRAGVDDVLRRKGAVDGVSVDVIVGVAKVGKDVSGVGDPDLGFFVAAVFGDFSAVGPERSSDFVRAVERVGGELLESGAMVAVAGETGGNPRVIDLEIPICLRQHETEQPDG